MKHKTEIKVPVYGMSCNKCVARVTAALQETEGVLGVDVSLTEKLGRVSVAPHGPSRDQLLAVVVKAGFQVVPPAADGVPEPTGPIVDDGFTESMAEETSVFAVRGMTCANCAQTIEKGVAGLPGVVSATVNFAAEKLSVVHDPARATRAALAAKVDDLGPLDVPLEEEFRVGTLSLTWLGEADRVEIIATESTSDDDDSPTMTVHLTGAQARSFVARTRAVVSAGRPPCPLCAQPLDPSGHICPRQNGFHRRS